MIVILKSLALYDSTIIQPSLFELIYDFLVQRHVEQAVDLRALGEVFLA